MLRAGGRTVGLHSSSPLAIGSTANAPCLDVRQRVAQPRAVAEKTPTRFPTSIYLPPEMHKRLRHYSERTGIPMSRIIRDALDAHLKRLLRENPPGS